MASSRTPRIAVRRSSYSPAASLAASPDSPTPSEAAAMAVSRSFAENPASSSCCRIDAKSTEAVPAASPVSPTKSFSCWKLPPDSSARPAASRTLPMYSAISDADVPKRPDIGLRAEASIASLLGINASNSASAVFDPSAASRTVSRETPIDSKKSRVPLSCRVFPAISWDWSVNAPVCSSIDAVSSSTYPLASACFPAQYMSPPAATVNAAPHGENAMPATLPSLVIRLRVLSAVTPRLEIASRVEEAHPITLDPAHSPPPATAVNAVK